MAILGVEGLKQEDEGAYRCVIDNGAGEVEHEFSIYVTGIIGHTFLNIVLVANSSPFSRGWHGLQGHVDEEEEACQEGCGGKCMSKIIIKNTYFYVNSRQAFWQILVKMPP